MINFFISIIYSKDVEIQLKTDVRNTGEGSRAFIFDNVTQTLTSNLVRNVTFKRGEKKLYRHKLYFSIQVRRNCYFPSKFS